MSGERERGRFGRDVLQSFGFIALQAGLALANSIVIARMTGPEGRGLYGLAVAMLALAWPLAAIGQQNSTVYFLGKGRDPGRIAGLNLLLALVLLPIGLGTGALAWTFGGAAGSTTAMALTAAAICLPAAVHFETTRHDYLGRRRVFAYNSCQSVLTAVLLALNLLLLGRGEHYVLVTLVATWVGVAAVLGAVRATRNPRPRMPSREVIVEHLRHGAREAASRFNQAALMRLDVLVLAPIVGLAALGIFAIADQISNLMSWLGVAAGRMMFAHSAQDPGGSEARRKLGLSTRLLVAFWIGSSLACVTLLWWLIPLVYTRSFSDAYIGVLLLLPAVLGKSIHSVVAPYLTGQGHQRPVVRAGLAALTIDIALVVGLAPWFGWEAAAFAKSIAHGVQAVAVLVAYRRLYPDSPLSLIPTRADLRYLWQWLGRRFKPPQAPRE